MREDKEKADRKRKRAEEKAKRRAGVEADAGAAMETGAAIDETIELEKGAMHTAHERGDVEKGSAS